MNGLTNLVDILCDALRRDDGIAALRVAAGFPHLGKDKATIMRGWEALIAEGIAALKKRYVA